jgi:hypothetical protein
MEGIMKRIFLNALCIVGFGVTSLASAEVTKSADLDALLESLSSSSAVESDFSESRHRGFRRVASDFRGIMRWDRELGLSLSYTEPRTQVMLIRPDGVFQSRGGQSPRPMPSSAEGDFLRSVFLDVFSFNRDVWQISFAIRADFDNEDGWEIQLQPLADSSVVGMVERIEISGTGDELRHLEIWRDERSRIVIEMRDARTVEKWSESVLQEAFFRGTGAVGEP